MPVRLKDVLIPAQPVSPVMSARAVFNLFLSDPDLFAIAITRDDIPLGLVSRVQLTEILAGPNRQILLAAPTISTIAKKKFICAEARTPVAAVAKQAAEANSGVLVDGVIVSQDGKYAGVVSPATLLKVVAEENAARARSMLKSRQKFENNLREIQEEKERQSEFCLLYTSDAADD